jgi:hypothetical protein
MEQLNRDADPDMGWEFCAPCRGCDSVVAVYAIPA